MMQIPGIEIGGHEYRVKASVLHLNRQFEDSVKYWVKALAEIPPQHPLLNCTNCDYAESLLENGQVKEAIDVAFALKETEAEDKQMKTELAILIAEKCILANHQEEQRALKLLESMGFDKKSFFYDTGKALYHNGELDASLRFYEKADIAGCHPILV